MSKHLKLDKGIPFRYSGRNYPLARHHAWGGLALLSLLGVVRLLFPGLPEMIWGPLALILVLYVLIWLFLTYRYRKSLKVGSSPSSHSARGDQTGEEDVKACSKREKKNIKAELKAAKKRKD